MTVAGFQRMSGIAKATGSPFEMFKIFVLVPIENVNKASFQSTGSGFITRDLPLEPSALQKFMAIPHSSFPLELDLETEPVPTGRGFETMVVGFRTAQVKAAA